MRWDDVVLFLAVVRAGSFTGAGQALGLHQSTVSRRIGELEEALGGPLFQRSARAFSPTALARRLVPEAEAVEAAMRGFERRAQAPDRPEGVVHLATSEELAGELLVPALDRLWAVAPRIDLVLDGRTELVPVGPGGADVALRVVRPTQASLRFKKVGELRYGVYASAAYLETAPTPHRWLALRDPEGRLQETRWLRARAGDVTPRLRSIDSRDLVRAAAAGFGVAVLPAPLAERAGLVCLETLELVRPFWLVTHEAFAHEARVRVVLDWVAETAARAAGRAP